MTQRLRRFAWARRGAGSAARLPSTAAAGLKIISWNLLRRVGASLDDVIELVERERPDLLLMQEVTQPFAELVEHLGGSYAWEPHPRRIHGLAMWSPLAWQRPPMFSALPPGKWFHRVGQIVTVGDLGIANVHLSHGQRLNRQQLREIAGRLPAHAAVLGDFNLVGPALLPGFRDVGPRWPTHRMGEIVPLRIDRCLVRGLRCEEARVLPRLRSDHRPICVRLSPAPTTESTPIRYREAAGAVPHRAGAPEGSAPADPATAAWPAAAPA